jgi:hypothetical protein
VNLAPSAGSGQVLAAGQARDGIFECQETGSQDSGHQGVRLDRAILSLFGVDFPFQCDTLKNLGAV